MKYLKKFLFIVFLVVAALLIYALFVPSESKIVVKRKVKLPKEKIWLQINNLKNFASWTKFEESDSTIQVEFSSLTEGVGAKINWKSDINGDGNIVISESDKYKKVVMVSNQGKEEIISTWELNKIEDSLEITWTRFHGNLSYPLGRLDNYFKSKMIEKSNIDALVKLEQSTINMKCPEMEFECGVIEEKEIKAQPAIVIKTVATMENISQKLGELYGKTAAHIEANGGQIAGPPISIYYSDDPNATEWEMAAGFPVVKEIKGRNEIKFMNLYEGKVLAVTHCGGYYNLGETYTKLFQFLAEKKYSQNGASWESYLTDPQAETDTSKWITNIFLPIK